MKISECIKQLRELMNKYGDIPAHTWAYDGQMKQHPIEGFRFVDKQIDYFDKWKNEYILKDDVKHIGVDCG